MKITSPSIEEYQQVLLAAQRMKLDLTNARMDQFDVVMNNLELQAFVRTLKKGRIIELATLGVVRKYRNQGIGALLVENLQKKMKEMYLVTVIPGHFKKLGFKVINEIPTEILPKVNHRELWDGYGEPVVMNWRKMK